MKQSYIQFREYLFSFYVNIFKRALVFACISFLFIWVFEGLRFSLIAYFFGFLGSFGLSFFIFFMKPDKPLEFVRGDI